MRYAEVAVNAPAGYDRTFSYAVPPSLRVSPGHLVRVPFGPRTLQGIAFLLTPTPQVPETREILATISPEPFIGETHLVLARWISHYYMCPLFDAAALMLPPGGRVRAKIYLSSRPEDLGGEERRLTATQRRVLGYVRERGTVEQDRLLAALGDGVRPALSRLVDTGVLVRSSGRTRPAMGRLYRQYARLTPEGRHALAEAIPGAAQRAPRQLAMLARLLDSDAPLALSDARKEYGASAVHALLAKGWIEAVSVVLQRDPLAGKVFPTSPPVSLTARQAEVAKEICSTLEDASAVPRTFLIHGVTGSGKTEIYLETVGHCLKLEKKAIVLVPEIALTHQMVQRFAARFPGQVAVLHSGLSPGQRYDQWSRIKQGAYGVVIGSRSAIFAPQPELRLIVIDEEHEWTYKQHDVSPRYHTRDVALKLAELTGAVVVMGSASPDVVSYYKGLRKEYRLLSLPERVIPSDNGASRPRAAPLARAQVVDMRRELREGNRDIFSRVLAKEMEECLDASGQAILFLNRRGSASYTQCRSCGFSLRCRRCEVALTYHREADRLLCHYCGYRRIAPARCPKCLGRQLSYYGVGTQAVVEAVKRRFPDITVLRWDRDSAKDLKAHEELLAQFESGQAPVLVGTQMIAKGLHFPSVTLVGVISADLGLNIPDYRAGERVFELLCQVAGRAGRGTSEGKVIVQTYQPDNYAVQAAVWQDYGRFYRKEMEYRREQANPPYSKLARLLYAHPNRALCEREAQRLAAAITQQRDAWGFSDVELLGPTPAYPARLRGRYRWHMTLRGPEPRSLLEKVTIPHGWVVDVDPVALT